MLNSLSWMRNFWPGPNAAPQFGRIVRALGSDEFAQGVAVSLPFDLKARHPSHLLFEAMRHCHDVRPELRDGEIALRSMPFRHVVLKGDIDHQGVMARTLERDIARDFSSYLRDFQVASFHDPDIQHMRAFFGFGVFLPVPDDHHVADIEFSWFDPKDSPQILVPGPAGHAISGDARRPAAWYEGQTGLALSFNPNLTPAIISRDGGPSTLAACSDELDSTVLFFGRRFGSARPAIEAFSIDLDRQQERSRVKLPAPQIDRDVPDWWLHDGVWQVLRLFRKIPLWFRITNRTGDVPFVPRARLASISGPRLVVRGILLPRPDALPFNGPNRWWLDFSANGELRSQEVMERYFTATAQWGGRYAIYDHERFRYIGRESVIDNEQVLSIGTDLRVARFDFDSAKALAKTDQPRTLLRHLYPRHGVDLLAFESRRREAFGVLPLTATRYVVSADRAPRTPKSRPRDPAVLGLDWLNRAAGVEMARATRGLADDWMSRLQSLEFEVFDETLVVRATTAGRLVEYKIPTNALMPLGPLYVEYKVD